MARDAALGMKLFHNYVDPDPMTLRHAILVYASSKHATILRSDITVTGGQTQLDNAVEVTADVIHKLLALVDRRPLTLIPENVVGMSYDACAWFVPAQPRRLLFSPDRDKALAELNGRSFAQPPLVFISRGRNLCVYALQENKKPSGKTPLYNSPYFNIFDNDAVCTGSATLPKGGDPNQTEAWELMFYQSNFTHRAGGKVRWKTGGTHKEMWEEVERLGHFDPAWLVPAEETLEEAVMGKR